MKCKVYQVQHSLKTVFFFVLLFITCSPIFAQLKVVGRVIDATTKETIGGVTITVKGKKISVASGIDGSFSIKTEKKEILEFSSVGYLNTSVDVTDANIGTVEMISSQTTLKEVIITNNQAIDRKTPIAVSTLKALQIEEFSANREFPEMLLSTPSVYATKSGGGAGDSRINIRGFSQENISVMVNGVPVNDMENGRVFWSNWSGLSEIASSLQVQRGLGATKLSIAAVGGNINIITKATEMRAGSTIATSLGNNGFIKTGIGFSTGKLKNGFAISLLASRTSSAGYIAGTASQAYNYFFTAAWEINKKNTITATVTGAPQWHNQRSAGLPYQTYYGNPNDSKAKFYGDQYNNSWGYYRGEEFSFSKNFFHKPVANLNYYLKINDKIDISTVVYGSLGRGGGTSYLGKINGSRNVFDTILKDNNGLIRVDDIEKWNSGTPVYGFGTQSTNNLWNQGGDYNGKYVGTITNGIVRTALMNEHNWYGGIVNVTAKVKKYFTLDGGIDLRYYNGVHYTRLEDALGLAAYFDTTDVNNKKKYIAAGDNKTHISYDYSSIVKQIGGYLSGTFDWKNITAFGSLALSTTSYQRTDYFNYLPTDNLRTSRTVYFTGYVTKGGASYKINNNHFVFANIGYFEKAPFFTNVFPNRTNKETRGISNEKIFGQEAGYNYRTNLINVTVNVYRTQWKDKNLLITSRSNDGTPYKANITGLNADHKGLELEISSRPIRQLELTAMGSVADWKWKNDVSGTVYDENNNFLKAINIYTKDVKVGNAAQTTAAIGANYQLFKGFRVNASYHYFTNLYADFALDTLTSQTNSGKQAWKLPAYGLMDASVSYNFRAEGRRISLRLNVDNVLNKHYLAEATRNVLYNSSDATDFVVGDSGSGKSSPAYPGFGRTWIFTVKVQL